MTECKLSPPTEAKVVVMCCEKAEACIDEIMNLDYWTDGTMDEETLSVAATHASNAKNWLSLIERQLQRKVIGGAD